MSLRARLHAKTPMLRGVFLGIPSPMVVEIACAAAPDFVCIDCEHGVIGPETLENMLRAASVPALVRVPGAEGPWIGQALDMGAAGVLVPRVSSAAEARAAVAAARFPPEGMRGLGPGRAAGYGRSIAAHLSQAREETVVAVQIETVGALDDLAAILAVPGLDLAFIGPADLGLGLQAAGRAQPLAQVIDQILTDCAAADVPAGIFTMTAADAGAYQGRVAMALCGSDGLALMQGMGRMLSPG
jgi:4-hydroxy-2-oxoheptanedioate aldolase